MINQVERNSQISQFYEYILKLNYIKDLDQKRQQIQIHQQNDQHYYQNKIEINQCVPLRFSSQNNYIKLWQSLFFSQVKGQIFRSKFEQVNPHQAVQFINLTNLNKFKLFNFKKINQSNITYLLGSLVVISPIKPLKNQDYPHLLGTIQSNQHIAVRVYLDQQLKTINQSYWQLLTTSKKWYIQNICQITTLQRQYKSLKNFNKMNPRLKQLILRPDLHTQQIQKKFKISQKVDQKLKNLYNQSQYKAIVQCLKQQGITLIQGPPGTGKTKTVLGTLSVLLNSLHKQQQQFQQPLLLNWIKSSEIRKNKKKQNPWLEPTWKDWRDQPFLQNQQQQQLFLTKKYKKSQQTDRKIIILKKSKQIDIPGKVAICGPSNASVDQIIRKMLNQKLFDNNGYSYLPNFVRIGQNYDNSLQEYSLESIANKISKKQKISDLNQIKHKILKSYKLIFGTLSSIGSQIVQASGIQFDTVVIDQAGQSIQISNLIPLMYGCKRLILIGDPNQLPATIFSQKCLQLNYDQSLFQRMMKSKYPVLILKVQYRMSPDISQVIGQNFYGGQLINDKSISIPQNLIFPSSFVIFHIEKSSECPYKKSFRNIIEGKIIKTIVDYISKSYDDIGVLSPYSQQVSYLQSLGLNKKCQIKTIDSFQGRQKNVIIFSSVRAEYVGYKMKPNKKKTIGFVSDIRRINVSLSRAKNLCIIVGDINRLKINNIWANIIKNTMKKGCVFKIENRKDYFRDFKHSIEKYRITEIVDKQ